ncbi:MAG: prepilin peptidase [Candidatus Omnitrophota bacterium]
MGYLFIFILGLIIGSFLNVCIYRIPRKESIIFPGSKCASCRKPIPWHDNIPLLSYMLLKARCRVCKARISFRYFVVELISAAAFLILFVIFGITARFYIYSLLTFALIVVTFIDFEFQVIPDRISIGGILLGIILSAFFPALHGSYLWKNSIVKSILGILTGGGIIYFTRLFFNIVLLWIRRTGYYLRSNPYWRKRLSRYRHVKDSMGMGDVKLMAMLGAFLGWEKAIAIFLIAPFCGIFSAIYLLVKKKALVTPYGPYISMAAFLVIIFWQQGQDVLHRLLF